MGKRINIICAGCIGIAAGAVFGGYWMGHKYGLKLVDCRKIAEKHLDMVRLYDIWVMTKQKGASIETYLTRKNIHSIAIYGMSYMGIRLLHELKGSSVLVKYGMDRDPKMRIPEFEICQPEKAKKDEVDAVVVTAVFSFDAIKKNLENLGFTKIMSLDEILYDMI